MSEHLIVLAIETDESQSNPAKWNWAELIDSPLPVGVVTSVDVTDQPVDTGLRHLIDRLEDM